MIKRLINRTYALVCRDITPVGYTLSMWIRLFNLSKIRLVDTFLKQNIDHSLMFTELRHNYLLINIMSIIKDQISETEVAFYLKIFRQQ